MNATTVAKSKALSATIDKHGLADRYMVGIRTIEAWQAARIITGKRQGKRVFFDVTECDSNLKRYSNN